MTLSTRSFQHLPTEMKWRVIDELPLKEKQALRGVSQDFQHHVDKYFTVRRVKTYRILADVLKSSYADNIDSLDLSESGLNDTRIINAIDSHNQFKELVLKHNSIGDKSMTSLSQIKSLKKIDLSGTFVTAEGLHVLTELPELHSLILAGNQSMGELGAILPRFPALKELDLSDAETSEASMTGAAEITSLRKLNVKNNIQFSNAVAASLSSHEGLEELNIAGVGLNSASFKFIADIRNLKSIDLRFNYQIGDEDIRYLCNRNKNLEQIDVGPIIISDEGIAAIAELLNLKKLSLNILAGEFGDSTIKAFAKHTALEKLAIKQSAPLSSEALRKIASIPGLSSLDFAGDRNTTYDAADIEPLAQNSSLEKLTISNAKMTEDGAMTLANIPSLKVLNFAAHNSVPVNHQTFTRLINHPNLQELVLNNIALSVNETVESPQDSQLETLTFKSRHFNDDNLIKIFTGLRKLKNITIKSIHVTDKTLIRMAKCMPTLEVVDLNITYAGANLMAALASLPRLRKLSICAENLMNNNIQALSSSTSLEELVMKNTRTNSDCLPALLEIKGLRKIDIRGTRINIDSTDVKDFLNSTIHSVRLDDDQIDEEDITALRDGGMRVDVCEYDEV